MDRTTLNDFVERQCKLAYEDGERGTWNDGFQQAMEIEWAVDQFVKTNFKEEQNND